MLLESQMRKKYEDDKKAAIEEALGEEVTSAIFTFLCPDKMALVSVAGFVAHGNVDPDTGDPEIVLTVECRACGKEHPVTVISIPKALVDKN
jgi:hypothetical protein